VWLVSGNLALKDLAPLAGAPPGETSNVNEKQGQPRRQLATRGDPFPNVPLHVEKASAMNNDVMLDAKKVAAPDHLPVQAWRSSWLLRPTRGVEKCRPVSQRDGELSLPE
jgi:hypothetical protein